MKKICLLIVFNHKFDRNLPRLRELYGDRFPYIRFVVPCYNGEDADVIPYYSPSLCFQGSFPLAYGNLGKEGFTHYVIIGDDLILNQKVTHDNIHEQLNLEDNCSFITDLMPISFKGFQWSPFYNAVRSFETPAILHTLYKSSVIDELPDAGVAMERFGKILKYEQPVFKNMRRHTSPGFIRGLQHCLDWVVVRQVLRSMWTKAPLVSYPLLAAYSDMLIIPREIMGTFAHYCGLFAMKSLHAEIAIPTALALATDSITTVERTPYKRGDFWGEDVVKVEEQCQCRIDRLFFVIGEDHLYAHPIKLTRWTGELK